MKKHSNFLLIALVFLFTLVAYQNCGDIAINAQDQSSFEKICADSDVNLTIVDTNSSRSSQGTPSQFQVFSTQETPSGVSLVEFIPKDSATEWPPRWFYNNQAAGISDLLNQGVLFQKELDSRCDQNNRITARFQACGRDVVVERNFIINTCPQECNEHGVVRSIGQRGRFYRSSSVSCGQNCEFIERECLVGGNYGPPINSSANSSEFTQVSCAQPSPESCAVTPGRPTASNYCEEIYPTPPNQAGFDAYGFTRVTLPFSQVFQLPNGVNTRSENYMPYNLLGASTLQKYMAIPVKVNGPYMNFSLNWFEEQHYFNVQPGIDFDQFQTGEISISVSPCPGDFRKPVPFGEVATDPFVSGKCRAHGRRGNLLVGSGGCPIAEGKTFYINIATHVLHSQTFPAILERTTCPSLPAFLDLGTDPLPHCGVAIQIQGQKELLRDP